MFTNNFKREYFKALGIPRDMEAHKHALDTAHRIREFEIQMYWKRALYFWGFQVVLFATVGNIVSGLSITTNAFQYIGLLMLSILGLVLSIFWLLMTKGAKFWHDNWERHVDLLEDNVVGSLYKTYPIYQSKPNPTLGPFSVSKINEHIIRVFILFWVLFSIFSIYMSLGRTCENECSYLSTNSIVGFSILVSVIIFFLSYTVDALPFPKIRMSNPGAIVFPPDAKTKEDESSTKKDYIRKR